MKSNIVLIESAGEGDLVTVKHVISLWAYDFMAAMEAARKF